MAYSKLRAIWHIQEYRRGLANSFKRRKSRRKKVIDQYWVLVQIISAFIVSFAFHFPQFLDHSLIGLCGYRYPSDPVENETAHGIHESKCKHVLPKSKPLIE